jgi:hypothetical protein
MCGTECATYRSDAVPIGVFFEEARLFSVYEAPQEFRDQFQATYVIAFAIPGSGWDSEPADAQLHIVNPSGVCAVLFRHPMRLVRQAGSFILPPPDGR